MVQYKRLVCENESGKLLYRPNSDASYKTEINRMRNFVKEYLKDDSDNSIHIMIVEFVYIFRVF